MGLLLSFHGQSQGEGFKAPGVKASQLRREGQKKTPQTSLTHTHVTQQDFDETSCKLQL